MRRPAHMGCRAGTRREGRTATRRDLQERLSLSSPSIEIGMYSTLMSGCSFLEDRQHSLDVFLRAAHQRKRDLLGDGARDAKEQRCDDDYDCKRQFGPSAHLDSSSDVISGRRRKSPPYRRSHTIVLV